MELLFIQEALLGIDDKRSKTTIRYVAIYYVPTCEVPIIN